MNDESFARLLAIFLRLGCCAFGGPVAHLAYFHDEFVQRRRWLDAAAYADLLALCQFLPGPASSQVAIGLGYERAGWRGACAAWLGFTAPGALAMAMLAAAALTLDAPLASGWLSGLKIAALAVLAHALWSLWRTLCVGWQRSLLALVAAAVTLAWPWTGTPVLVLLACALAGRLLLDAGSASRLPAGQAGATRPAAWLLGIALVALLLLPILAQWQTGIGLQVFERFYRVGALVFGGGHVVLPLLQAELVEPGLVDADAFLAGYGIIQALPGPLFNLAAYLGALIDGPRGALLAVLGIFLPGALLVLGALPWWRRLAAAQGLRRALAGVNAGVVGLLLAALYRPTWEHSIEGPLDLALAALALLALRRGLPPWAVVALCAVLGWVLGLAQR